MGSQLPFVLFLSDYLACLILEKLEQAALAIKITRHV
jgi:hypothetical protein